MGVIAEVQQFPDRFEGKAQLSRVPDEGEPVELIVSIAALATLGPARFRHQTDLLVIADRLHLGAGFIGQTADRKHGRLRNASVLVGFAAPIGKAVSRYTGP